MANLKTVPLSDIRENKVALRTVNRESEAYQGLVESIRQKGFLGSIVAREKVDEDGTKYFEIVDGLHRYSAAKDLDLPEITIDVTSLSDDEVLEGQIMMNIHRIETRPVEYTHQLRRILKRNQDMTESELAGKPGKSTAWLSQRLGLSKIEDEKIQQLIDDGEIKLSNAYALAKLGSEDQREFVERAMMMPPDEFTPLVNARCKEVREARRKGDGAPEVTFEPRAFLQKVGAIKEEHASSDVGPRLVQSAGASTAEEGFALAVAWVLHLDPESVERQRAEDAERRRAREEAKKARAAKKAREAAEKQKAKAEEAAKIAAELEEAS
jgi:ParB/RepB/Spo0J family partition protein